MSTSETISWWHWLPANCSEPRNSLAHTVTKQPKIKQAKKEKQEKKYLYTSNVISL